MVQYRISIPDDDAGKVAHVATLVHLTRRQVYERLLHLLLQVNQVAGLQDLINNPDNFAVPVTEIPVETNLPF